MISPDASGATETPHDIGDTENASYASRVTSPAMWAGLKMRTLSALALIALMMSAEITGGLFFTGLILVAALMMIREWDRLTERETGLRWRAGGILYVALPCLSIIWLRNISFAETPKAGMYLVLYLLFVVWATDIGAYFAGRSIGGAKLAPAISPNKTWAGLGGGMLAAGLAGGICTAFTPYPAGFGAAFLLGVLLAVIAQAGDLFESWLKRRAGVKDSGTLIPGHGGILDRIDGLVFAAPILALFVAASGLPQ